MENVDFNFNNFGGLEKNYLIHTFDGNDNDNSLKFSTRPIFSTRILLLFSDTNFGYFIAKNKGKFTIFSSNIASISSKFDEHIILDTELSKSDFHSSVIRLQES